MRIVVLVNDFGPPWDEAGKNNALAVGRFLARERGHQISFVGLGESSGEDQVEGLPVIRTASPGYRSAWKRLLYPFGYLFLMARCGKLFERLEPDVLLCFWETASTGIPAACIRAMGAPKAHLVQVVWTDSYTLQAAPLDVWFKEHLPNLLFNNRLVTSLAGWLVDDMQATSRYLADRLGDAGIGGVTVGSHGVDIDQFQPRSLENGRDASGPGIIGYLGHATHAKGIDVLLDALTPELAPGKLELRLSLSRSPESDALIARSIPGVQAVGITPAADFFNECDLAVLPRVSSYGTASYPNTVLEAMACGKPVLTTRQPAIDELIEDGKTGFLVPPGDVAALRSRALELMSDRSLRESAGKAAREFVLRKLSWERVIAPLEDLLDKGRS